MNFWSLRRRDALPMPASASEWVARMRAGALSRHARHAMRQWLEESPEHARELLRAEATWRLTGTLEADEGVVRELTELDRLGSSRAGGTTERRPHGAAPLERVSRRVGRVGVGHFAAAGIAAAVILFFAWDAVTSRGYQTMRGEQRIVTLADGSVVALNTDTRLTVKFTDDARSIVLKQGEALFQVARDAARPFTVHAGAGYARAVGTRFNVLARDGKVTVSVLEGRVEVGVPQAVFSTDPPAASAPEHSALLQAGESAAYGDSGDLLAPEPTHASAERIIAWREGKLRFDAWSVERAVREYNRYAEKSIRVEGTELDSLKISGVFRIGDSAGFVAALRELVGGRVVDRGDVLVLTQLDPASDGRVDSTVSDAEAANARW